MQRTDAIVTHPFPLRSWMIAALALSGLAIGRPATGQSPVGFRDITLTNSTGNGSSSIRGRVWYPSQQDGRNTPLRTPPTSAGYATIVFQHGFAALGSWYGPVGNDLAAAGYIVFAANTAQFDRNRQRQDGIATYSSLRGENNRAASFLRGAIDLGRVGLCGHSMGGGNTVEVLANNPGYRAGVCFAPVDSNNGSRVGVPMAVVHGQGDAVVSATVGSTLFGKLATKGSKVLYLLDSSANHTNVTGFALLSNNDRAVWTICARFTIGFFDRWLREKAAGSEAVVGATARNESRVVRLDSRVGQPSIWWTGSRAIGAQFIAHVHAEPGPAAILLGAAPASAPTPFGTLRLAPPIAIGATRQVDPTRRSEAVFSTPNDPTLVGKPLWLQAGGTALVGSGSSLRLGNAATILFTR